MLPFCSAARCLAAQKFSSRRNAVQSMSALSALASVHCSAVIRCAVLWRLKSLRTGIGLASRLAKNGVHSPYDEPHGQDPQVVGDGEEDLVGFHASKA